MNANKWYEFIKQKDHLIVIREKLGDLDPRYDTTYVNMFLLIGSDSALLIDTGCGLFPLKSRIREFIMDKKLFVVNTHSHFDHIGANGEFSQVFIHEKEHKSITVPLDLSFLKDLTNKYAKLFEDRNYVLQPTNKASILEENQVFDLGKLLVKYIYSPGHSPGSISLYTNKGELFTGDLAHYGALFLPPKDQCFTVLDSISKLINLCDLNNIEEIYPAHEDFLTNKALLTDLFSIIENIDNFWEKRKADKFNKSWVIEIKKFKFFIKVGMKERREFREFLKNN